MTAVAWVFCVGSLHHSACTASSWGEHGWVCPWWVVETLPMSAFGPLSARQHLVANRHCIAL